MISRPIIFLILALHATFIAGWWRPAQKTLTLKLRPRVPAHRHSPRDGRSFRPDHQYEKSVQGWTKQAGWLRPSRTFTASRRRNVTLGQQGKFFRADYQYDESVPGWTKLNPMPLTWEQARFRCSLEGSTLASPITSKLERIMKKIMTENSAAVIFLGISSIYSSLGHFHTVEGYPLDGFAEITWAPDEPNNIGNNEQCIAMYADGSWADVNCTTPLPFICFRNESKYAQDITPNFICGTIDQEYIFDERTGHCYKVHRIGHTWDVGHSICSAEGGYLAIINSAEEQDVLKDLLYNHAPAYWISAQHKEYFGIGFRDWSEHGEWMTIHGQTLKEAGFDKWAPGQPDNYSPGEYCGGILRNAMFDDVWCDHTIPFICEREPPKMVRSTGK
ncbi:lectin c-type domain-containing protein [Phthorimaea operculella]|nr:lectin c-type domain-containing protein [Phthorimaea operculella]